MSKDHFPVNDKTIADVNAANTRAYSGDAEDSTPQERTARKEANPSKVTRKLGSMTRSIIAQGTKMQGLHGKAGRSALQGEAKATNNWKNEALDAADHVRESKQEHGEDAEATSEPSPDTVHRVRSLYTSGHGTEHIKKHFNLSHEHFHAILSGKYGKGKVSAHKE